MSLTIRPAAAVGDALCRAGFAFDRDGTVGEARVVAGLADDGLAILELGLPGGGWNALLPELRYGGWGPKAGTVPTAASWYSD